MPRRKEKSLSIEEAMYIAKTELTPLWFGSLPLIGGVKLGDKTGVYPIEPGFTKSNWIIFFVDSTSLSGEFAIQYAKIWHKRYSQFGLRFMAVFSMPFKRMAENNYLKRLNEKLGFPFPVSLDPDGSVASSFEANEIPSVILWSEGNVVSRGSGESWVKGFESEIQNFLRKNDPGLALARPDPIQNIPPFERASVGFGKTQPNTFVTNKADFEKNPESIFTQGTWTQSEDGIITQDPEAVVKIMIEGTGLSIIAETLAKKSNEAGKVIIEINESPIIDAYAGRNLNYDEEGRSFVYFRDLQVIHICMGVPAGLKQVTFKFPNAKRVQACLCGFREI
jgi:hypothetical protein